MSTSEMVPTNGDAGVSVRQEFSSTEMMRGAETAMAAMAAQSKALVEARFIVAMRTKRVWPNIRISVLNLCKDPGFAAEALYVKPLAATPKDWSAIDKRERLRRRLDGEVGEWPMGFSIRFIEAALFECGNFDCTAAVAWEDDEKRITIVSVLDLERNQGYSKTLMITKVVERSYLKKNEEPIATRYNTNGQMVYVLAANPQQVEQSEAAAVSKTIRTLGEKLLPPHYKAEWRAMIEKTILDLAAKDPEGEKKKLFDAFAEKGVLPSALEKYLEHSVDEMQPAELVALRKIFVAVSSGEVTWRDVMESKFGADDDAPKESAGAKKVKEILRKAPAATAPQPQSQQSQTPSSPQASGAPPAGSSTPSPSSQPGSSSQPIAQPTKPAVATAPAAAQDAPAPPQDNAPPADLPHLEDWPDDLNQDWYWIGDILFQWNEASGNYAKHSDRPFAQPKPESKTEPRPESAKRQPYAFPRRNQ